MALGRSSMVQIDEICIYRQTDRQTVKTLILKYKFSVQRLHRKLKRIYRRVLVGAAGFWR